jgi:hypothetical protein
MKREGSCPLEQRRHGAERLIVLDDLSSQVADVDLIRSTELASGHNSERALLQGEIGKLPANLLDKSFQGRPIGSVGAGIQASDGL